MARLVTSGFEWKDSSLTVTTGPDGKRSAVSLTYDTGTVRTGAVSLKADVASGGSPSNQWTFTAVTLGTDAFGRVYIYVPTGSLPVTGQLDLMGLGGAGLVSAIQLETNGTLTLWANVAGIWTQQGSASAAITLDSWNRVELRCQIGTGSVDQVEARLEGTSFASASGLNITDTQISSFFVGNLGTLTGSAVTAGVAFFDDVAVNDASGASQTSWPGDGKVALLKPISDNAGGTGWTLGTGTALGGNGFDAVNNTPPTGVADLTALSDPKQIRNASSNANVNYDANLTTYTNAGIGATDTINVLVPIVATGAPVTTSAKAGTIGISSNPVIANVSLGAGGTAGAFWSGVAAGTDPTGWKWSPGTTTYAPTVTRANSPVARITQVTASTRIAMVCAMGMYVDYTPAGIPQPHEFPWLQAVTRAANW